MTEKKEIEYLLPFVSEAEKAFFFRMYPNGIDSIKNKKHAISQIKSTLFKRTKSLTFFKQEIEELKIQCQESEVQIQELNAEIEELKKDLKNKKNEITSSDLKEDEEYLALTQRAKSSRS